MCTFNRKYKEAEGALLGEFQRVNADIAGNRDFLPPQRGQVLLGRGEPRAGPGADRLRRPWRSARQVAHVYEVTEEFYVHNGRHGTREDVVFLINGIPVRIPTIVITYSDAS